MTGATTATLVATLILAGRPSAGPMWRGIAGVAIGVTLLTSNNQAFTDGPLFGIASVGLAAAFVGGGIGSLFRDELFIGVPTPILGATALCLGATALALDRPILGTLSIVGGLILLGLGALIFGLDLDRITGGRARRLATRLTRAPADPPKPHE